MSSGGNGNSSLPDNGGGGAGAGGGGGGGGEGAVAGSHPFVSLVGLWSGSWATFFIVVCACSLLGARLARVTRLPLLTAYMLLGVLVGPSILGIVKESHKAELSVVTQTALAFIAFSAGSELYLPELRSLFRVILSLSLCTSVLTFAFCALLVYALSSLGSLVTPWMSEETPQCRQMISLVVGSIMVARSPAAAIAVVRELRAQGKMTSVSLGVTVLADVIVLVLFTLSTSLALAECSGSGFRGAEFLLTMLTLAAAVGIGLLFGQVLILLLWLPRAPWARWTILPLGLLCFILCDWFAFWSVRQFGLQINFDALLICISAAYTATNGSKNRLRFMHMLGVLSPYVFVPFFVKTGVEIQLATLGQSVLFALATFVVRGVSMGVGGLIGGRFFGGAGGMLDREQSKLIWLTMISQAGVSLGLASEVATRFPAPSWGPPFQTAVLGVIVLNTFIGPITHKYVLKRAGEDNATPSSPMGAEYGHHQGQVLSPAPELELTLDPDADEEGMMEEELDEIELQQQGPAGDGARVHQRRATSTRGSMQQQHPSRSSVLSPSSSASSISSVPPPPPPPPVVRTVVNIHGARLHLMTRRAVFIGVDGGSLALAQRLLDVPPPPSASSASTSSSTAGATEAAGGAWSVLLLDESIHRCAQALATLGARLREQQLRQADLARNGESSSGSLVGKVVLSPLSKGIAWLKRLPSQASEGLVAGLDVLLPPPSASASPFVPTMQNATGTTPEKATPTAGASPIGGDSLPSSPTAPRRSRFTEEEDAAEPLTGTRCAAARARSSSSSSTAAQVPLSPSNDDDDASEGGAAGHVHGKHYRYHRRGYDEIKEEDNEAAPDREESEFGDVSLEEDAAPTSSGAETNRPPSPSMRVAPNPVASASSSSLTALSPTPLVLPARSSSPVGTGASGIGGGGATSSPAPPSTGLSSRLFISRLPSSASASATSSSLSDPRVDTLLDSVRAVEEELFLSSEGAIDAIIISALKDGEAYDLTKHFMNQFEEQQQHVAYHRSGGRRAAAPPRPVQVFVRLKNPSWAGLIADLGACPLYGPSVETQLLAQMISGGSSGSSETSIPFASAPAGSFSSFGEILSSSVRAEDDLAAVLLELPSEHDRREYTRVHPPPPAHLVQLHLAAGGGGGGAGSGGGGAGGDAGFGLNLNLTLPSHVVVPERQRHGYMDAMALMTAGAGGEDAGGPLLENEEQAHAFTLSISSLRHPQQRPQAHRQRSGTNRDRKQSAAAEAATSPPPFAAPPAAAPVPSSSRPATLSLQPPPLPL